MLGRAPGSRVRWSRRRSPSRWCCCDRGPLSRRSSVSARTVDVGFDPRGRVSLSFNLRMHGYTNERAIAFQHALLERRVLFRHPIGNAGNARRWWPGVGWRPHVSGSTVDPDARRERVSVNYVWPEFFSTLGIPLVGSSARRPRHGSTGVDRVVSEAMVRHDWPGRGLSASASGSMGRGAVVEVVGVARETVGRADREALVVAYLPGLAADDVALLARASIPPGAVLGRGGVRLGR